MLDDTAAHLREAGAGLTTFHDDLADALASGDADAVRSLLAGDASSLASALAAPVELRSQGVFPVANFGSGMAPYYTFSPVVDPRRSSSPWRSGPRWRTSSGGGSAGCGRIRCSWDASACSR